MDVVPGPLEGTPITTTHRTVTTPKAHLSPATQRHALPAPNITTTLTQLHIITTRAVPRHQLILPPQGKYVPSCTIVLWLYSLACHEDAHWTSPFSYLGSTFRLWTELPPILCLGFPYH